MELEMGGASTLFFCAGNPRPSLSRIRQILTAADISVGKVSLSIICSGWRHRAVNVLAVLEH